ncbi:hypothetical protein PMAYCL1PPCAC_32544, partial [Pristionchus mayeri]
CAWLPIWIMLSRAESQSKRKTASRSRTKSEPPEGKSLRNPGGPSEEAQRVRGMSLRELKALNAADEKQVREKVEALRTKVRQMDRRRTTTVDRSVLRALPSTPSPLIEPPRSSPRTLTPARHQRVAGHPARIPSRARETHARSQSHGCHRR